MLSRLSIRNYAIIDSLEVDFSGRLNVITGETGAGKSIIVGALGLILGQRADSNVLLSKDKKCVVEGCFKGNEKTVQEFLQANELDILDEVVVRREISTSGKSRAFINDTPVNLSQLNQLSNLLVDLHQQFDTLSLGESDFQREVLDALAQNFPSLAAYRNTFERMGEARRRLEDLRLQKAGFEKEYDYHQFQFNELEEADFKPQELEQLEQELALLSNAEGIRNALTKIYFELEESEEPVNTKIKGLVHGLNTYTAMHPQLPSLVERLQSVHIELQDIAGEADHISNAIGADPATLDRINERMSIGYKLLKKHGVKTTDELIVIRADLAAKLEAVLNIDDAILKAENDFNALQTQANGQAQALSTKRQAQVKPLEKAVNAMLVQVGMPNARIKVSIEKAALGPYGSDDIQFLFDANKKDQFQPLRKVASGGELSRLMLCIKSLVAASMDLPTLIFDEIDTGISGEAAKQVGAIMKSLASARQVICITHQPQIAGRADAHYLVYKSVHEQTVQTAVRILTQDERIVAIARMLGGEKPTAAAIENAREMIMN